jgi:hypothetical protein
VGDKYVDDLPELVDRPIDVAPLPTHLDVGLIDLPAAADRVSAGPGGVGQQRREAHHPPVDGGVVDLDAALGKQLLGVAVGEAKAQVPADRQHDHIRREAGTGEGRELHRSRAWAARSHDTSLAAQVCSHQMQQRPTDTSLIATRGVQGSGPGRRRPSGAATMGCGGPMPAR